MNESLADIVKFYRDFLNKNPKFYGSIKLNFLNGKPVHGKTEISFRFGEKEKKNEENGRNM